MDFKDLYAYQKAFDLAMHIFEISKTFPKEEQYSLTDQIRRSCRSVCAQIAEAYRKREYPRHFISKLTDGDAENAETQVWLEFALECQYIKPEDKHYLLEKSQEVGKLIATMIRHPEKFGVKI